MPLEVFKSEIEGKNRHEQVKVPVLGIEKRNSDKAESDDERHQTRSPFRDPCQIHKELVGQPLVSAPSRFNDNRTFPHYSSWTCFLMRFALRVPPLLDFADTAGAVRFRCLGFSLGTGGSQTSAS